MEGYEILKDIGSGNFAVAKLVRDNCTNELFAVKFIERGQKVFFIFFTFSISVSFSFSLLVIIYYLSGFVMVWVCDFVCGLLWKYVLQIDEHVQREIMNHRSLKHPNIIRFKEVSKSKLMLLIMSKRISFIFS